MARKITTELLSGAGIAEPAPETNVTPLQVAREGNRPSPLAPGSAFAGGAVGALTKSLQEVFSSNGESEALRRQLEKGETIVELDPAVIDGSFVHDRMAGFGPEFETLVESIKARGQQVPILVRPHPEHSDRYQVAYGHRRLRAVAQIGGKVRAVVKKLTDEELVIAQGQENNARLDLTCIEQARFAARLEERGFTRAVIIEALGIDKTALSKLISIATKIPTDIIDAIGHAPSIGRARWLELVEQCLGKGQAERAREIIAKPGFDRLSSDDRFLRIVSKLTEKPEAAPRPAAEFWNDEQGRRLARIKRDTRNFTLQIDQTVAPEFGDYLITRLNEIYADFQSKAS